MREPVARPSSVALWTGVLLPPVAWAVDLTVRYALVPYICNHKTEWMLVAVTIVALIAALYGGASAWRGRKRAMSDAMRVRFMSIAGLFLSVFFAIVILANAVPHLYMRACD